ncbi:MAG: hypothetical protein GY839_14865 [candidate division Zixibacteria bacterium]|nr:hypothetical protein [candidate division Zixibacteria bacterium]
MTPDARGRSLADGGGAFSDGASSSFYNPANLALVTKGAIDFSYVNLDYSDDTIINLYVARNTGKWGYWGVGINCLKRVFDINNFNNNDSISNDPRQIVTGGYIRKFSLYNPALSINMAYDISPTICIGVGAKYINTRRTDIPDDLVPGYTGQTFALDFGIGIRNIFRQSTLLNSRSLSKISNSKANYEGLSLGISMANIGPGISYDENSSKISLPKRMRLSAGYQIISMNNLGLRATLDATTFLIDIKDYRGNKLNKTAWHYGFETSLIELIQIRAGIYRRELYRKYFGGTLHTKHYYDNELALGLSLGPEWFRFGFAIGDGMDYAISLSYSVR